VLSVWSSQHLRSPLFRACESAAWPPNGFAAWAQPAFAVWNMKYCYFYFFNIFKDLRYLGSHFFFIFPWFPLNSIWVPNEFPKFPLCTPTCSP
jgi:hypothetical protein